MKIRKVLKTDIVIVSSLFFVCAIVSCGEEEKQNKKEGGKLSANLVVKEGANQHFYQKGTDVVLKDEDVVIGQDTIKGARPEIESKVSDSIDSISVETVVKNKVGDGVIFFKQRNKSGFICKQNDSIMHNVEQECFVVSDTIGQINNRPYVVLGNNDYHPEFGIRIDKYPIKGHEAVEPTKFFVYNDTLLVRFGKTEGVDSVRIIEGLSDSIIFTVREFDKDVKVPVKAPSLYRISAIDHASILVRADSAEVISLVKKVDEEGSSWIKWLIYGLLALLVLACVFFVLRKIKKRGGDSAGETDNGTGKEIENESETKHVLDRKPEEDNNTDENEKQLNALNKTLQEKNVEIQKLKEEIKCLKPFKDDANKIEKRAEEAIAKEKQKAERQIQKAKEETRKVEKERDEIKDKVEQKMQKQIDAIQQQFEKEKEKKEKLDTTLKNTQKELSETQGHLKEAQTTIENKEKALFSFKTKITDVGPLEDYAKKVEQLLLIGKKVEEGACQLNDWVRQDGIDKNALVAKYIARYHKALLDVDMSQLTTDAKNIANVQFVYNTQTLAHFDQNVDFGEKGISYFFENYLKKYVDALFTFNETLAGLHHLIGGLDEHDCEAFARLRDELLQQVDQLEMTVLYSKVFDDITDNIDIHAEMSQMPGIDCMPGTILQINNCIVYRKGGNKPNEKINVIVKE